MVVNLPERRGYAKKGRMIPASLGLHTQKSEDAFKIIVAVILNLDSASFLLMMNSHMGSQFFPQTVFQSSHRMVDCWLRGRSGTDSRFAAWSQTMTRELISYKFFDRSNG